MSVLSLICHSCSPAPYVRAFDVDVERCAGTLLVLRYRLRGEMNRLRLPQRTHAARTDALWKHTCFEVFLKSQHAQHYAESNFSPSTQWAAYRFSGYRQGMTPIVSASTPKITCQQRNDSVELDVKIDIASLDDIIKDELAGGVVQLGVCAILETHEAEKSYWALAHPSEKPDFHRADGFTATLPSRPGEVL